MKRMKKLLAMALALVMCLSLCVPALACDNAEEPAVEVLGKDTYFVHTTREEYIAAKADSQNISYEEAEAELDAKITAATAALPSPAAWQEEEGFDNGDTTRTVYGWLYKNYAHKSGAKVEYGVRAVKLCSRQGNIWVELRDSTGYSIPSSGNFTINGEVTSDLPSSRIAMVSIRGYLEVAASVAISLGFDLEVFTESFETSGTTYLRSRISDHFTESAGGGY